MNLPAALTAVGLLALRRLSGTRPRGNSHGAPTLQQAVFVQRLAQARYLGKVSDDEVHEMGYFAALDPSWGTMGDAQRVARLMREHQMWVAASLFLDGYRAGRRQRR